MYSRIILIVAILFLIRPSAEGQEWIELSESQKLEFMEMSRSESNSSGCHRLEYAFYNFTLQSTPTERLIGYQCIFGDTSISNVHGRTFGYADPSIAIEVDSASKTISVGYNNLYPKLSTGPDIGIEALFARTTTIKKLKTNNKSGSSKYRITSIENNGIDFYETVFADERLAEVQIHYHEITSQRFRDDPEVSKPIVSMKFTPVPGCYLNTMMYPNFFLRMENERTIPAARFRDFKVKDFRVIPSPQ